MTREQDPLEPRQALRRAGGINDVSEEVGGDGLDGRKQALAAELDATRTEIEVARDAGRQAEAAALARAEMAERAREDAIRELAAAGTAAAQARAEAERFQKAPGLRGRVVQLTGPHRVVRGEC